MWRKHCFVSIGVLKARGRFNCKKLAENLFTVSFENRARCCSSSMYCSWAPAAQCILVDWLTRCSLSQPLQASSSTSWGPWKRMKWCRRCTWIFHLMSGEEELPGDHRPREAPRMRSRQPWRTSRRRQWWSRQDCCSTDRKSKDQRCIWKGRRISSCTS